MLGDQIKAPNKSLIIDQLSSFNSLNYLHIPHHQRQALFLSSSPRSSSHSYLTVRYILYSLNRQTSSSGFAHLLIPHFLLILQSSSISLPLIILIHSVIQPFIPDMPNYFGNAHCLFLNVISFRDLPSSPTN